MFKLIFVLLASITLWSADSQVDLRIDTNPFVPQQNSSLNVTSTNSVTFSEGNRGLLFSPEMTFHLAGAVDFSLTTAHRHRFKNFILGHNVFLDRTHIDDLQIDQIGTGLDFLAKDFDVRFNYYHPLTQAKETAIYPNKWVDSEVFFKTKYFGVGTGPLYNIDRKDWALHSRVVVPLKTFSVHVGALCGGGDWAQSKVVFSVSFHLFKPRVADRMITPPCHLQRSSFYYTSMYVPPEAPEALKSYIIEKVGKKGIFNPKVGDYLDTVEEGIALQDRDVEKKDE